MVSPLTKILTLQVRKIELFALNKTGDEGGNTVSPPVTY